ncbi:glycosyltransferase family 4 protein [Lysinibacillus sp. 3P01SB]|uniref:glycosyltransferase family 4 protein n=1 Tax=Lysinibacillus sp. 3P01SB TaxID=3132284 RepID=UPI0039A66A64
MKILLCTYWTIPHIGGVWGYMQQLKKGLEEHGHEVDLMGCGEENNIVHIVGTDRRVEKQEILPFLQAKMPPELYPDIYSNKLLEYTEFQRYFFELGAAYLGLEQYDLIHTQDVISTAGIRRVNTTNVPMLATIHGSVAQEMSQQLQTVHKSSNSYIVKSYYDELEKIGATSADLSIVANQWLKNVLTEDFDVPESQLRVLHYGFDTENFIKQKQKKVLIEQPPNKKVIVYTGRLVELKGVQYLIQALAKLKAVRQDWVCWIVGEGEMKKELQLLSKSLKLENDVYFLGSQESIPSILAKSHIFVLPSLIENQPLSLIEAQLAGKPAIVTNIGGLPEMVEHGVTGLVVEPRDANGLFESLDILLSNPILTEMLRRNAKIWGMTHWSYENGFRKLLAVYDEVISMRKTGESNVE